MRWLLPVAVVGLASLGAARWSNQPVAAQCRKGAECGNCHAGSLPPDHVPDFISEEHGEAAREDRIRCRSCHEEETCVDCHLRRPPIWHSEASRNPGRDPASRAAHIRAAEDHAGTCLECHQPRFRVQCARCHVWGEPGFEERP